METKHAESEASFRRRVAIAMPALQRRARKLTGSHENAQDLLQDLFIHACKQQHNYSERGGLHAWLYILMKRIWINERCSGRGKLRQFSVDASSVEIVSRHISACDSMDYGTFYNNLEKQGNAGEAMRMWLDGYKYREISAQLNIPEGTVRSRIWRSRQINTHIYGKIKDSRAA